MASDTTTGWLRLVGATIVVAAVMSVSAGAEEVSAFMNGDGLYHRCGRSSPHRDTCIGYVIAINDVMWAGIRIDGHLACAPERDVTSGKLADITLNFLRLHPELRHHAAASVVARALGDAFPCQ
jgi:hypothetical protein